MSFLAHNNAFIFLLAVFIFMHLKNIFNILYIKKFKFKLITLLTILIGVFLVVSLIISKDYLSYIIKNGVYLFNIKGPVSGHLGFSFSLISSFSKYLFFVQLFTLSFIIFLKVKSDLINYMALYTYLVFFMVIMSMIFHLNFDMMIFRLLYVVKYVFVPLCFVYFFRKIIGKKCSI